MAAQPNIQHQDDFITERWWEALLLLTGMSAFIYFICWRHLFFFELGPGVVNETITLSVFILGLAFGASLGGELSHRYPGELPKVFMVLQLVVGAFGLLSYPLLRLIASQLAGASASALPFLVFFSLMVPTLALGAFLPVCLRYVHQRKGDIGQIFSGFLGGNLVGAALGAVFVVLILFLLTNLIVSLLAASALNFAAAGIIYRRQQGKTLFGKIL